MEGTHSSPYTLYMPAGRTGAEIHYQQAALFFPIQGWQVSNVACAWTCPLTLALQEILSTGY